MSIAIPHKRAQWLADLFFAPPLEQEYLAQRTMAAKEIEPKPVRLFPSHKPLVTHPGITRFASRAPMKAPLRMGGDFWTSLAAAVGGMWVLQGFEEWLRRPPVGDYQIPPETPLADYFQKLNDDLSLAFEIAQGDLEVRRLEAGGNTALALQVHMLVDGLRYYSADVRQSHSATTVATTAPSAPAVVPPTDPLTRIPEIPEGTMTADDDELHLPEHERWRIGIYGLSIEALVIFLYLRDIARVGPAILISVTDISHDRRSIRIDGSRHSTTLKKLIRDFRDSLVVSQERLRGNPIWERLTTDFTRSHMTVHEAFNEYLLPAYRRWLGLQGVPVPSSPPPAASGYGKWQSCKARAQALAEQYRDKGLTEKMDSVRYRQEVLGLPADKHNDRLVSIWGTFLFNLSDEDRDQVIEWTVQATGRQHLPSWGGARPRPFSKYPNGPLNGMHTKKSLETERLRLAEEAAQQVRRTGKSISVHEFRSIVLGYSKEVNTEKMNDIWGGFIFYQSPEVRQQLEKLCKEATGYKNLRDESHAQARAGYKPPDVDVTPPSVPPSTPDEPPPPHVVEKPTASRPEPRSTRPAFGWLKGPPAKVGNAASQDAKTTGTQLAEELKMLGIAERILNGHNTDIEIKYVDPTSRISLDAFHYQLAEGQGTRDSRAANYRRNRLALPEKDRERLDAICLELTGQKGF